MIKKMLKPSKVLNQVLLISFALRRNHLDDVITANSNDLQCVEKASKFLTEKVVEAASRYIPNSV
jgi:hypothetical protein